MRADTRIAAGYVLGRRHTLRTAFMPAGAGAAPRRRAADRTQSPHTITG